MADIMTTCNICLKEKVACDHIPYVWNGLQFIFLCCAGCYGLLSFGALVELREERDDIYQQLNKPKEEEAPQPETDSLEEGIKNPPVIEIDPVALREALNETETDD